MQGLGGKGQAMIKQHQGEIKKLNFGLTEPHALQDTQVETSSEEEPETHCTRLFTAAPCAAAGTWKHATCPSGSERADKMGNTAIISLSKGR